MDHHVHIDGSSRMKHEKIDPDRDHLDTIAHWSGSFDYHGINYPYTMVGTDPRRGSATTVVPTVIIPLRFVFADGSVVDAGTELIDGQTAVQGIVNSPIFQPYPFVSGGTRIGNTQWPDAFQRANFWNHVATKSKDYHVLLGQPTILPSQTINVPADKGGYFQNPDGSQSPFVEADFSSQQTKAMMDQLGISPRSLAIFVTARVYFDANGFGFGGYHGATRVSSKKGSLAGAHTYIVTSYHREDFSDYFPGDVIVLSHEINEWMDDPFGGNSTPGWNYPGGTNAQCDSLFRSGDALEVCDPIDGILTSASQVIALPLNSFTYHIEDAVFLDFFTRSSQSNSVNGQYSFFGQAASTSLPCTGHLQVDFNTFSVAGAISTFGGNINNRGQIVGAFQDAAGATHGFLLKGKKYATLDPPGAIYTSANGISDVGVVVGFYYTADGLEHGFSYQNGQYTTLDFPGALNTSANGINNEGQIVGDYFDDSGIDHGFSFGNGSYQTVNAPGGVNTALYDVNDSGLMIGITYTDSSSPQFGFLRLDGHYTGTQFPGALFTVPTGLSNLGDFVGYFANADGNETGFINLSGHYYAIFAGLGGVNDLGQMAGATSDGNGNIVGFTAQAPVLSTGHDR